MDIFPLGWGMDGGRIDNYLLDFRRRSGAMICSAANALEKEKESMEE